MKSSSSRMLARTLRGSTRSSLPEALSIITRIPKVMKFISDSLAKGSERMTKIEYLLYAVIVAVLLGPGAGASLFAKIFGL